MAVMMEEPSTAIVPSLEEQVQALQRAVLDLALWGCGIADLAGQMWQLGTVTERQIAALVWKCRITQTEAAAIMLAPRAVLSTSVPVVQIEIMAPDMELIIADMATPAA